MTKIPMNLQDSFLNAARRQNVHVTITLIDGTKIKGRVNGFDNFTVILDINKISYLVYKHAIINIFPERPLDRPPSQNTNSHSANNIDKEKNIDNKSKPIDETVTPINLEKFKVNMENK